MEKAWKVLVFAEVAVGFSNHMVLCVVEAHFFVHAEEHTIVFLVFLIVFLALLVAAVSCAQRVLAPEPLVEYIVRAEVLRGHAFGEVSHLEEEDDVVVLVLLQELIAYRICGGASGWRLVCLRLGCGFEVLASSRLRLDCLLLNTFVIVVVVVVVFEGNN